MSASRSTRPRSASTPERPSAGSGPVRAAHTTSSPSTAPRRSSAAAAPSTTPAKRSSSPSTTTGSSCTSVLRTSPTGCSARLTSSTDFGPADGPQSSLGESLVLPEWLEGRREEIESGLPKPTRPSRDSPSRGDRVWAPRVGDRDARGGVSVRDLQRRPHRRHDQRTSTSWSRSPLIVG